MSQIKKDEARTNYFVRHVMQIEIYGKIHSQRHFLELKKQQTERNFKLYSGFTKFIIQYTVFFLTERFFAKLS